MPSDSPATSPAAAEATEAASPEAPVGPQPPRMISTSDLRVHPGNVRENLNLTHDFCASIAEVGVRIPLLVTTADDGAYRVIEGHRRLAAAIKVGLTEVPCHLDASRADDQAGQYLDMVIANSPTQRRNLAPVEEAIALFAAHEAGASRTRLRKATGRKAEDIKNALQAGGLSEDTRTKAGDLASELTLDQLALLAEFDDDKEAVTKILEALRHGYTVEYTAERIRQDRAEAAEHQRLRDELQAAGTPITGELPAGAVRLTSLTHEGDDLTPEVHASCPGRGAYFPVWNLLHPVHYCTNPDEHGHAIRSLLLPPAPNGGDAAATSSSGAGPAGDPVPDPSRRIVIEGNKAWAAAAEVRKRWLQQFFARRTAPRELAPFIAGQLLTMPEPLRLALGTAHLKPWFSEITGQDAEKAREACGTCQPARLPLFMFAPIAVAYEGEMNAADASRRSTWRDDRYSPCPRKDAGRYLTFLASLGYQLSVIEQAVADGVPYTGDDAAIGDLDDTSTPDGQDTPGEVGASDGAASAVTASAGGQSAA